jgi:hypothetical protein
LVCGILFVDKIQVVQEVVFNVLWANFLREDDMKIESSSWARRPTRIEELV